MLVTCQEQTKSKSLLLKRVFFLVSEFHFENKIKNIGTDIFKKIHIFGAYSRDGKVV